MTRSKGGEHSRRTVLGTVGAAMTGIGTGCLGTSSSPQSESSPSTSSPPEESPNQTSNGETGQLGHVVVWNEDGSQHEVQVQVVQDSETVSEETLTVGGGDSTEVDGLITEPGTYTINVGLTDSDTEATYTWDIPCEQSAEYLQARIRAGGELEISQMTMTMDPLPDCNGTTTGSNQSLD